MYVRFQRVGNMNNQVTWQRNSRTEPPCAARVEDELKGSGGAVSGIPLLLFNEREHTFHS